MQHAQTTKQSRCAPLPHDHIWGGIVVVERLTTPQRRTEPKVRPTTCPLRTRTKRKKVGRRCVGWQPAAAGCEFVGSGSSYAGIQNGKTSNAIDLNRILNVLGNEYNVCSACNSRSTASHGQIMSAASGRIDGTTTTNLVVDDVNSRQRESTSELTKRTTDGRT